MPELAGCSVRVVDVAGQDALIERYGERLPVLLASQGGAQQELDWPFDAASVRTCLAPAG